MIRNEKGFALVLLTMAGASILIALVVAISKKTSSVLAERGTLRNKIISQRIYQDLAILMRTAYEQGVSGSCATGTLRTYGGVTFCFNNGTNADCAINELGSTGFICFTSGTTLVNVTQVDSIPTEKKSEEYFVDLNALPQAHAQSQLEYPATLNAAQVTANTWGAPTSVPLNRTCGASPGFLCYQLLFCPLKTSGACTISDRDAYVGYIGLRRI